jgi:hypothetical protein
VLERETEMSEERPDADNPCTRPREKQKKHGDKADAYPTEVIELVRKKLPSPQPYLYQLLEGSCIAPPPPPPARKPNPENQARLEKIRRVCESPRPCPTLARACCPSHLRCRIRVTLFLWKLGEKMKFAIANPGTSASPATFSTLSCSMLTLACATSTAIAFDAKHVQWRSGSMRTWSRTCASRRLRPIHPGASRITSRNCQRG